MLGKGSLNRVVLKMRRDDWCKGIPCSAECIPAVFTDLSVTDV